MAYLLIALLFIATYLFFETINLIVGNKENIKQKRFMFILTSASISVTIFYLISSMAG